MAVCKNCRDECEFVDGVTGLCDECHKAHEQKERQKKQQKKQQKKSIDRTKAFNRIKQVPHSNGSTRLDKSINLFCDRFELYKQNNWDKSRIIKALRDDNHRSNAYNDMRLGATFNNNENVLPTGKTYKEYYLLSGSAGETKELDGSSTPRLVKSNDGNVYFSSHYDTFISLTDGTGKVIKKGETKK